MRFQWLALLFEPAPSLPIVTLNYASPRISYAGGYAGRRQKDTDWWLLAQRSMSRARQGRAEFDCS
ncbi:hypothetical protein X976_1696 [Burkholderia pseudomallei MSHR7500]|nr:hypothetical protein DP43_873 [Burkholderia pseudomallei]KGS78730.1 hypothetical protein X976_1696 [Burkholderia pseudomallei MSHR7500]